MRPSRSTLLILLIAAGMYFGGLAAAPLWDRDEPRNAGCAREMAARQDWVVPYFNGELRTHKPVLLYWLILSAYQVFGEGEFAARFWSAALSLATVGLTIRLGTAHFGPRVGAWSGMILATSLLFTVSARACTPDATLVFFTTLSLSCYPWDRLSGGACDRSSLHGMWLPWRMAAAYAAMGLATLTKGPIGFLLPMAVLGIYALLEVGTNPADASADSSSRADSRRSRLRAVLDDIARLFGPRRFFTALFRMRAGTGLLTVFAIALPWYIWVGLRTNGVWPREFLGNHNLSRALQPMEGHDGNLLFYPLTLLVGFFPWSVLTIPCVLDLFRETTLDEKERRSRRCLLCWVGVVLVGFSLASTKLPSYVLPAYPAVAILLGRHLARWQVRQTLAHRRWYPIAYGTMSLVGGLMIAGLGIAAPRYLPGETRIIWLGAIPLVAGVVGLALTTPRITWPRWVPLAACALLLNCGLLQYAARRVGTHQEISMLFRTADQRLPAVDWAAFGGLEPTWVYYRGRPIREFAQAAAPQLAEYLQSRPETIVLVTESNLPVLQAACGNLMPVAVVRRFLRPERLYAVIQAKKDGMPALPHGLASWAHSP